MLQPGERVLVKNLTPTGGPGKLRNYWKDTLHTVVYEVRPEHGKGHSRVLHRNLLMPCDHLPFEKQPENAKKDKQQQGTRHEQSPTEESDCDSGDEYELHYEPLQPPTVPAERNETSLGSDMELEHGHPQTEKRAEIQVHVVPPTQLPERDQCEEFNQHAETLLHEDKDLPAGKASPSSSAAADPGELPYQLPPRERHPPKRMTYDQLGILSCYCVQPSPQMLPIYPAPGLAPWLSPLQPYYFQPPFMYGLQQA